MEIYNCPCCHSKAWVIRQQYYPPEGDYQVICSNELCELYLGKWFATRELAIEYWNNFAVTYSEEGEN